MSALDRVEDFLICTKITAVRVNCSVKDLTIQLYVSECK